MNILQLFSRNLYLISTLLLLISSNVFAQIDIEKGLSKGKLKARGQHARKVGDLYSSIHYYEEAIKNDSSDIEIIYQLAELYQLTRNYPLSEKAYEYVFTKASGKYPFSLYEMAIMQKMCGRYEEAKKNLNLFRKEMKNLGDKNFKLQLGRDIAGCDSGISYRDFPDNVNIKNAGNSVNHPHVEFSPLAEDTNNLKFGSLRIEKFKYYENEEQAPKRQIYKAIKNSNNEWEETGPDDIINDPNMDMGNFVYSPISDRYYFTKCDKNSESKVICKLYFIERSKGKWSEPALLPDPINLDGFSSTQPCIMYDTINSKANTIEYLYYVSNRPDGKGGMDIWSTYYNKAKKEWVKPSNVVMMNTTEDECTPYFHVPTQTFYFSSTGHTSAGGFDIFKIVKKGTRFLPVQNMSFPINSPQDDIDFKVASRDGLKGFFVSNRFGSTPYSHETCCDDIFSYEILPAKPFECKLAIKIDDNDTTLKDHILLVKTHDNITQKSSIDSIKITDDSYTLDLKPNKKYIFKVLKDGIQPDSLVVGTREMASTPTINKTLSVRPEVKDEEVEIIPEAPTEGKAFVLSDITYGYGESILSNDAIAVLDTVLIPFLKLHPKDKLIISSHTDDVGSHKYNLKLSQARAENVLKHLISRGIPAHRLQAHGYGESKPIAPNNNPDGSPNPLGQSINRRTEFLLTK